MNLDKVMREHLRQLVGRKVTGLVKDPSPGVGPIWGLKFDDGTMAFILCDPEGNGPGHLEIQRSLP
jgi:hypothetical protein